MESEIVKCTCSMANSDFSLFEVFLSSFLAFLSALAVEAIWEGVRTRGLRKQLQNSLLQELNNIENLLDSMNDEEIYIRPYSIPVWSGASKSGSVLCLDKIKEYNKIITFFSLVEEANIVEMKAYEILNINPLADKEAIMKNVNESRALLKKDINAVKKLLEG